MEHKYPSPIMEYGHHHPRQAIPMPRPPQQSSGCSVLPDFSLPPPPFVPNCPPPPRPPPPLPPQGLCDPYPKTSPWDPNSEIRYNVPFCPQLVPEPGSHPEGYIQGLRDVTVNSSFTQLVHSDESVKDREWVKLFTMYKSNKCEKARDVDSLDQPGPKLKIFEAKLCVEECQVLLQDLENHERDLMDRIENLSTREWQNVCDIIETKKIHLEKNLRKMLDPTVLKDLQVALVKRQKKRRAIKRRRMTLKEEKVASSKRRHQLHLTIDTWLEQMQQSVEKVKLEESLKHQADIVLSDVTRKKAEARRQLTLLSTLLKLRRIRVQAAESRGEHASVELVHIFENVIEKLQKFWSDQLKDYNMEERGLRVMLEEATEDSSRDRKTLDRRIMSEWQKLMFGRNLNSDDFHTVAERDVEEFVKIRHEWDKFVVPSRVPMASPMPIGWVLPVQPSSEHWEKLIEIKQAKH